jgi:hypothetical protein
VMVIFIVHSFFHSVINAGMLQGIIGCRQYAPLSVVGR